MRLPCQFRMKSRHGWNIHGYSDLAENGHSARSANSVFSSAPSWLSPLIPVAFSKQIFLRSSVKWKFRSIRPMQFPRPKLLDYPSRLLAREKVTLLRSALVAPHYSHVCRSERCPGARARATDKTLSTSTLNWKSCRPTQRIEARD